jgi:predicted membrane-bound dolichyl-phosphate-mannose-protein mannosyltransferase
VLLVVVSLASLGARVGGLGDPCNSPCNKTNDHLLVFDEAYYVNAARVIAGLSPPAGAHYAGDPSGDDPNAEHPQLVKLVIAGSIELFGDGPLAWRLGSLICGSLAILGMYALTRAAGGGRWLALGTSTLMAADNLMLVMGRIGTLDIYVLAAMVWSAALYLRGRPLAAGALLGVGACAKEVAPYLLLVFALLELLRWTVTRTDAVRRLARLAGCAVTAWGVFFGLLAILDRIAPPYDPVAGKLVTGGPFGHFAHMVSYAAHQTSPHGPTGIASYPWQWIFDYKPITYLAINPVFPPHTLFGIHASTHFLGMISPPIMLLALPGLALALVELRRRRDEVGALALAWSVGTFVPFELQSLIWNRTSYIYYMLIVMPGIYLAVAQLVARGGEALARSSRRAALRRGGFTLIGVWALAVLIAVIVMYPFTPWPS